MATPKVLYICHNHPSVRPGGSEMYALELYEAMRAHGEFEAVLLAKGGPPLSETRQPHEGTLLALVDKDPNQYFFYNDKFSYDLFYNTFRDKRVYTNFLGDFLLGYQPEVVHFQHTLFQGYDMLRAVRNFLPKVAIVYTLHEFFPICHNNGQMVRTFNRELCAEETPRRCHECFPGISPQDFFLRKRFIQSHLSLVDLFLAPSRFLMERYVEWGIPRDKIRHEPNGRKWVQPIPDSGDERSRDRLGFFGQMTPFKGIDVLLRAMKLLDGSLKAERRSPLSKRSITRLQERGDKQSEVPVYPHLWFHGANLDLQHGAFQEEVRGLLEDVRQNITVTGRYEPRQLPQLMAGVDWVVVPSIWWENAPLVIQEAFQHGRPVICSDIGGMAEHVTDGINGLHFRAGDPQSLAQTILRAVNTPGLWESLRKGIPPVHRMEDHVSTLSQTYREIIEARRGEAGHAA